MTTKNDITGDSLVTKSSSAAYRSGWDAIFKKTSEGSVDETKEVVEVNDKEAMSESGRFG